MSILLTLAFWKSVWQAFNANIRLILIAVAIGGVILAVIGIRSCIINQRIQRTQDEINNGKINIDDAKTNVNAIDIDRSRQEVANTEENTNVSFQELNDARGRDSSDHNSNVRTVTERFCRAYPDDSRCKPR